MSETHFNPHWDDPPTHEQFVQMDDIQKKRIINDYFEAKNMDQLVRNYEEYDLTTKQLIRGKLFSNLYRRVHCGKCRSTNYLTCQICGGTHKYMRMNKVGHMKLMACDHFDTCYRVVGILIDNFGGERGMEDKMEDWTNGGWCSWRQCSKDRLTDLALELSCRDPD